MNTTFTVCDLVHILLEKYFFHIHSYALKNWNKVAWGSFSFCLTSMSLGATIEWEGWQSAVLR